MKLDKTGLRILAELDKNARITVSQLAKRIRVSRDVVQYRIKQLENDKIIDGYYTLIDHRKLDYILVRLYINYKNTTPEIEEEIETYFADLPNSLTVYQTEGQCDVALGLLVKSHKEFNQILHKFKLKYRKYVESTQINIMVELVHYLKNYLSEEHDDSVFVAGAGETAEIVDLNLLDIISSDARIPLIKLAKQLNLTTNAVKYKLKKLEKDKVILAYRAKIDHEKIGYEYYKVDFNVEDASIIPSLVEFCRGHPNITYEDRAFGGSDYEFDLEVRDYEEFIRIINELKNMFPEKIRNWKYYKAKKIYKIKWMVSLG